MPMGLILSYSSDSPLSNSAMARSLLHSDRSCWSAEGADPELPTPEPVVPHWGAFNLALLSDADFQAAASVNQLTTVGLTITLNNVMLGLINPSGFGAYVNAFVSVAGVTSQQRESWATIAKTYNLPSDVVTVIRG